MIVETIAMFKLIAHDWGLVLPYIQWICLSYIWAWELEPRPHKLIAHRWLRHRVTGLVWTHPPISSLCPPPLLCSISRFAPDHDQHDGQFVTHWSAIRLDRILKKWKLGKRLMIDTTMWFVQAATLAIPSVIKPLQGIPKGFMNWATMHGIKCYPSTFLEFLL